MLTHHGSSFVSKATGGKEMKTINVTFDDKEYRLIQKQKKEKSWHDFILSCARGENGNTTIN